MTVKPLNMLTAAISLSLATSAGAAVDKRWFETEVILFTQLGDKGKLQEAFTGDGVLSNHPKVMDLLTPYLYPDVASLTLQLPSCDTGEYEQSYRVATGKLPALFPTLSLEEISLLSSDEQEDGDVEMEGLEQPFLNAEASADDAETQALLAATQLNTAESTNDAELDVQANENSTDISGLLESETIVEGEAIVDRETNADQEVLVGLTDEEVTLIAKAQTHFVTDQTIRLETSNKLLCQDIPETPAEFVQYGEQLADFNQFPIDELRGELSDSEFVYTDQPYLINEESLQLKDIALQLKRSRDFRPMLHFGWRQSLVNRRKPSREPALKIIAGKHYQQTYKEYVDKLKTRKTLDSLRKQDLDTFGLDETRQTNENGLLIVNTEPTPLETRLNNIYQKLSNNDFSFNTTLSELDDPALAVLDEDSDEGLMIDLPITPNQDWELEGYFRLHLNHYLHITADFNVAVPTKDADPIEAFQYQLIPFSQHKRVISKEVHYFDHPYMGMIVQIRRYTKPEPDVEEITEENNNG
ncbi:CsiV family protein [Thalassotalea euphylliae]|uniref:CsiV family protein n=1 Tax=Thalassotalea euphylliae TaxID=1655234 RepID=UPI00362909F6